MAKKEVTLTIDGIEVTVPEGTIVVDAAKKAGIDIPVFCYHPKMEPVGMCRMCLVEIGRPVRDRETGEFVREEDGSVKIQFAPKLETACTNRVSEGMVVLGTTEKVKAGREDILEFLLTSHPLDCPICDKGGECPLQNLTMGYGPGVSRYLYDEKMRLAKNYPLGELIYLDRERCIQCGRCVRFQDEIVDDPVIGFYQRGRALQIVTYSDPGFDSYFSGNTTDICPVGALTTADFRFRARPWQVKPAASICTQCPVGCNTTLNVRREAASGGRWIVKRMMPRQNEQVNEIWICDKGRFGYHYAQSNERLTQPLMRKDGNLVAVTWDEALDAIARRIQNGGDGLLTLAGGRLSNEDLYNLRKLTEGVGGKTALYSYMAGGDLTAQVGLGKDTNFSDMGPETAILVVASDLEEEAPIWWLRVKQAAERGARLIVLNPRPTKLDRIALHKIRYPYGSEAAAVMAMLNSLSAKRPDLPETAKELSRSDDLKEAARIFSEAENGVVIYGSEGTGLETSRALTQACANLLLTTGHTGKPNNGLLGVWQRPNDQGAWDMGYRPIDDLASAMQQARVLYVVAADPARDMPELTETGDFMVVQDLFLTDTGKLADVVLPVQSFLEREGSYTNGERRVQRFYPALPEMPGVLTDFKVAARLGERLGLDIEGRGAARVFLRLAEQVPAYQGLTYLDLAQVYEQWPIIGRGDLYYGGTSYENSQGVGVQLQSAIERGENVSLGWQQPPEVEIPKMGVLGVPVTRLYDMGNTLLPSHLLDHRRVGPSVMLHPSTAERYKITEGVRVQVTIGDYDVLATAHLDETLPAGVAVIPRSVDIPIAGPAPVRLKVVEKAVA